jgi:serine O-acetyltransferase
MDCEQNQIVKRLMDSYSVVGGINHVDCGNLPSKPAVAALCEDLLHLLFPGFFSEVAVFSSELEMMTNESVASIRDRLIVEVRRSLRLRGEVEDPQAEATRLACAFLMQLPGVRALLQTDVQAAYDGDPAARSFEEIILAYPGLEAIAIQRLAHVLYSDGVPLLPRMMTEWAHGQTGIDIHPGARIGTHFFIDHGTGVVIGETCVIGNHVKLYHGVTLGARSFQKDDDGNPVKGIKRHPNVEDDVTIYPNATVLGGDTVIGARSTIGANVFLMESVPPDRVYALGDQTHRIRDKSTASRHAARSARPQPAAAVTASGESPCP